MPSRKPARKFTKPSTPWDQLAPRLQHFQITDQPDDEAHAQTDDDF